MGSRPSKPQPCPPSPTLLSKPWRNLPQDKQEDLEFVKSYRPLNREVNHLRVLLYGPIGAGKSSFINSVDSILNGRISGRAPTDAISSSSFTKKYKTYRMRKGQDSWYPFIFNDIMGFEKNTNKGVHVEDVKLALKGHVAEGYQFKPEEQLKEGDEGYNAHPTLDDKVQVLICVIPADNISLISPEVWKKMREVRLAAGEMDIPQLAILTKVDVACQETQSNIKNAYSSKYLKKKVEEFHMSLGIPASCIFLVKNYDQDPNINDDMNALIMNALRQMIVFGEDFLCDQ